MNNPIPRLREDLEFIPTVYQGEQAVIIRDFLGLIQKPIMLQGDPLNLLGLINGKNTIQDIQLAVVRQRGGILVAQETIERLLDELDRAFLLDSSRYRAAKQKLTDDYAKLKVRNPSHAGQAYPASKEKLGTFLDAILETGGEAALGEDGKKACALISPHIDFEAGKRTYARAYCAVKGSAPQKIILLGTGHNLENGYFSLTDKDFKTPLGLAKTDRAIVKRLASINEQIIAPDDLAHRREHSLEFQLIFLQHLFGPDLSIVPILCGSFRAELSRVSRPSRIPGVDLFLGVLADILGESPRDTLVVAGVDFSHIGPKFGHGRSAASLIPDAKKHDKILIDACVNGDVEAFWAESQRVKDEYNVCGFSALACLLELFPRPQGRLLDYDVWMEETTRSAVSFAALAFYQTN